MQKPFAKVAETQQVPEGRNKVVYFMQREIAIFCVGGRYYAIDNLCPHKKGPLSEGHLLGTVVVCPLHEARFDLLSGKGLEGPHQCDTKAYDVQVEGNAIRIRERI